MLDTVQVALDSFEVSSGHALTVRPASFRPSTGEVLGEVTLWPGQVGAGAYINAERFNLDVKPYGKQVSAVVHLSLPRFVAGSSNVDALTAQQARDTFGQLESELERVGVRGKVSDARVSRVDVFKNVQTAHPFETYTPVFSLLDAKRAKDRTQYGGEGYLWKNSQQQICAYDKVRQTQAAYKQDISARGNLSRFEWRLLNRKKVWTVLGVATVSDLLGTYENLESEYGKQMGSTLFRWEPGSTEVLSARHIEDVLRVHKATFGRYWMQELLKMLGASALLSAASVDTLTEVATKVAGNRMAGNRFRRSLVKYQMRQTRFAQGVDVVPVSELYGELREKVLRLAA